MHRFSRPRLAFCLPTTLHLRKAHCCHRVPAKSRGLAPPQVCPSCRQSQPATIRASSPREKRLDATIFELAGLPVPANPAYRFRAEEIKQTAFRLDGLLQPETGRDDLPLIFVETQFYPNPHFYARWLAAIFLHLYRHPGIALSWSAIAVFPDRAADTGRLIPYEPLLQCGLVHRVYLAELPDDPSASFRTRLARLAVLDATRTVEEARALLDFQTPTNLEA